MEKTTAKSARSLPSNPLEINYISNKTRMQHINHEGHESNRIVSQAKIELTDEHNNYNHSQMATLHLQIKFF